MKIISWPFYFIFLVACLNQSTNSIEKVDYKKEPVYVDLLSVRDTLMYFPMANQTGRVLYGKAFNTTNDSVLLAINNIGC